MDEQTLLELGEYLNDNPNLDTCNNTLDATREWLEAHRPDQAAADLEWIAEQGATCDCEVVLKLYLPQRNRLQAGTAPLSKPE